MSTSIASDDRFRGGSSRNGARDDLPELQLLPAGQDSAPERFGLQYLPGLVASRFREALACYSHDLWQAFAAMCRQTATAVFADVGEPGRLRIYDQVNEVQDLAQIDEATFSTVRRILFDSPVRHGVIEPEIGAREAAVLLETMKDLLTQTYVRRARLRQALMVRQFFAGQPESGPAVTEPTRNVSGF